jgi:putative chitobiose transport system substrate-binding protein
MHGDRIVATSGLLNRRNVLKGTGAVALGAVVAPRTSAQTDEYELEFWTINLKGPFTDWVEKIVSDFEEANPGAKVTWVDVPGDSVAEKYLSAFAAKQAPDVANIYQLPRFVQAGAVLDVTPHVTPEEKAEFFDAFWDALSFGDGIYGIPWYANTQTLVYSKQIFRDAELDPENPPTTYADALEAAKTIYDQTGKYGMSVSFGDGGGTFLTDQLLVAGVDLLNEDRTQAALNTPEAAALLQMWVDAYQANAIPPEAITGGDAVGWFLGGQAAMFPGGAWVLNRTTPEVIEQLDFGVANGLVGAAGKYTAGFQFMAVSAQSETPAEAVKFGLHAAASEYQLELAKRVAVLPSNKAAMEDAFWSAEPQDLIQEATLLSATQLDNAIVVYSSAPPVVAWQEMVDVLTTRSGNLLSGDQSPEDFLTEVETEWNRILSEES